MKNKRISVAMDSSLYQDLVELSETNKDSISETVRKSIKYYVTYVNRPNRKRFIKADIGAFAAGIITGGVLCSLLSLV